MEAELAVPSRVEWVASLQAVAAVIEVATVAVAGGGIARLEVATEEWVFLL